MGFPVLLLMSLLNSSPLVKALPHGLYLSVIEISMDEGENEAKLMRCRVFMDDLENALRHFHGDIVSYKNKEKLQAYFTAHFELTINHQTVPLKINKHWVENDVVWIEWAVDQLQHCEKLEIKADYFMELYPTQKNMVHVKNKAEKRFVQLTIKQPHTILDFN